MEFLQKRCKNSIYIKITLFLSKKINLYEPPYCKHMANIAQEDKKVKDRVNIFYFVKTVEHRSGNIGDTLSNNPEEYPKIDVLIERLYCNKNSKSHQHITGRLYKIMLL